MDGRDEEGDCSELWRRSTKRLLVWHCVRVRVGEGESMAKTNTLNTSCPHAHAHARKQSYPAQPPGALVEDAAKPSKVQMLFLSTFQNWHVPPVEMQLSQHSPASSKVRHDMRVHGMRAGCQAMAPVRRGNSRGRQLTEKLCERNGGLCVITGCVDFRW